MVYLENLKFERPMIKFVFKYFAFGFTGLWKALIFDCEKAPQFAKTPAYFWYHLVSNVKTELDIFSNFVAFSEYLYILTNLCGILRISSEYINIIYNYNAIKYFLCFF